MKNVSNTIHNGLLAIVGAEHVLSEPESLQDYRRDKSPFAPSELGLVARPASADEISAILKLANEHSASVVARGGGFSLTGLLQSRDSIIVDTRRMNQVIELDEVNMTVTAECGIIMKDLYDHVAARGYYVHTVGIPIGYTTLGGVLSGVQGGGYPSTLSVSGNDLYYLLGLKVVLPDGTIVDTNAGGANVHRKSDFVRGANAPDLTGLFVGDGGSFGIKAQASVQIFPVPKAKAAGCWDFADFSELWSVLLRLTALPTLPYETVMVLQSAPLSMFYFCRADDDDGAAQAAKTIDQICADGGGILAAEEMQSHAIEIGESDPDYQDIFVNVDRGLLAFVTGKKEFPKTFSSIKCYLEEQIEQLDLEELGVSLMIYFCPMLRNAMYTTMSIVFDSETPGSREAALELQKRGYEMVVAMGAAPEPHQGFASQANAAAWSPEYAGLMSGLKKLVDPKGVLNADVWNL